MNILLTSAGRRTYLVEMFKESLGKQGKVFASNLNITPTLLHAHEYVLTPPIYDDQYIDFLLEYCHKKNIKAIIPLFDVDLSILSKNKERFKTNGIDVIVSDYNFVKVCNDKWQTYNFFQKNNIPTVKTYIYLNELIEDIKHKKMAFPIIIKPRFGMGSIGVYVAYNMQELKTLTEVCLRCIKNTYLKFESVIEIDKAIIYQEYIQDSQEYGIDIINNLKGDFVNAICKQKIAMRAGETDIAETVDNKMLKQYAQKIASAGKHIANLDCDVLMKGDKAYFIELNCRFGGGYPFSHAAGVNLPLAIIKWLQNKDGAECVKNVEIGVRTYKEISLYTIGDKNEGN